MTIRVTENYIEKFWNRAPLSPMASKEFLALPYHEAVYLMQRIASGNEEGLSIGIPPHIPVSLPGFVMPTKPSEQNALRTQKLLVGRRMQAHVISHFGARSPSELMQEVEFHGLDMLDDVQRSGSRICLINSHVGPALLVPILLARMGYRLMHMGAMDLAGSFDLEDLERIQQISMNGAFGAQVLAVGLQGLQNQGMLHLTGDGFQGLSGTARPFLGKLRRFPQGPAYLGVTSGATLIPVFTRLSEHGRLRVTFHSPLQALSSSADKAIQMDQLVAQYTRLLQKFWLEDFGNVGAGLVNRHLAMPDSESETEAAVQR